MSINLNDFAKEITEEEGLKDSLTIAQVKEVLRLVFEELACMDVVELGSILKKYQ